MLLSLYFLRQKMKPFFSLCLLKIDPWRLCRLGTFALVLDMCNTHDCMPQDLAASSAGVPPIRVNATDSGQGMQFEWGRLSLEQASNERGEICISLLFLVNFESWFHMNLLGTCVLAVHVYERFTTASFAIARLHCSIWALYNCKITL